MLSLLLEKSGLFFRHQPFERQGRVHFLVSYPHCHISIHGLSVDTVGWTGLILSLSYCFGRTRLSKTRPGPQLMSTRGLILRFTPNSDRIGDTLVLARLAKPTR